MSWVSYRQTLWYLLANWRSFVRWSPDQWVSQYYAIECYRSFYCALFCLHDSCESMFNQPALWTPGTFTQFGNTGNYSAIAILHTFQFTVTHALGYSVVTSRILATDLIQSHCNFKSHVESSLYRLIPFLPFLQLPIPKIRLYFSRLLFYTPSTLLLLLLSSQSQVKVTLRLTVSQSVSLGVEPHLGLMTRYLLLFDSYGLVFVERPLWSCRTLLISTLHGPHRKHRIVLSRMSVYWSFT
jgi:hypothetical protein